MSQWGPWSNSSQEFTQLCILESQLKNKDVKYTILQQENLLLKLEVEKLQNSINTLTTDNINSSNENKDILDRFK